VIERRDAEFPLRGLNHVGLPVGGCSMEKYRQGQERDNCYGHGEDICGVFVHGTISSNPG
jgi:hypothetical protein